jgi:hypothetical protein
MNSMLLTIINYSSIYISFILLMKIYSVLLNKKLKIKTIDLLILIPLCIAVYKTSFINSFALKTVIIIFSFVTPYFLISNYIFLNKKGIFSIFSILVMANLIDFIFASFLLLLNINSIVFPFLDSILTILVPLIILYVIKSNIFKKYYHFFENIIINNINIIFVLFIWIIIIVLISYLHLQMTIKNKFVLIVITILIDILFIINIIITTQLKTRLTENMYLSKCLDFYISYSNKLRIFKHNIVNDLLSVRSLLPNGEINYLDIIINKYSNRINKSDNIKNSNGLSSFIYEKAKIKGFNIRKIYLNCNNINNKKIYMNNLLFIDICETIGILLDNSIESSKEKNTPIFININQIGKKLKISIVNEYNNNININKIGKFLYSTKANGNGIGLYFINKNKRIKLKIKIINTKFISDIETYI